MKLTRSIQLAALLATSAFSPAQDGTSDTATNPFTPPAELKKLHRLLGSWEGSGTATMAPGTPATTWTAKQTSSLAVGGHALRDDTVISFPEGTPGIQGPLVFRGYTTWDRENKRFVAYGLSNEGSVNSSEITFIDENTMLSITVGEEQGQKVVDRWVTWLKGDTLSFKGTRTIGTGDAFTHVEGSYKRTVKGVVPASTAGDAAQHKGLDLSSFKPFGEVPSPMAKLNRMAGTYSFEGSMCMAPGGPPMSIGGKEVITPVFGGSVLWLDIHGAPPKAGGPSYECIGAIAWDKSDNRYKMIYVNNMGESGETDGWLAGDVFIGTQSGTRGGQPYLTRSTLQLDSAGRPKSTSSHSLVGTHSPFECFKGNYTRN
ncbi:MAG: DUF1579 family protein [Planctomycetes bacterium]|nr:DUF1579 family protein [Planctomycetota bacterium]MCB9868782.1 DUF1579 family protein [Planctomycetota bacterium]